MLRNAVTPLLSSEQATSACARVALGSTVVQTERGWNGRFGRQVTVVVLCSETSCCRAAPVCWCCRVGETLSNRARLSSILVVMCYEEGYGCDVIMWTSDQRSLVAVARVWFLAATPDVGSKGGADISQASKPFASLGNW